MAGRVLAGGLVQAHDLRADPAAFGDCQARCPGPGPDGRAIDASASGRPGPRRRRPRLTFRPPAMYGATAAASRVLFADLPNPNPQPLRERSADGSPDTRQPGAHTWTDLGFYAGGRCWVRTNVG